MADDGNARAHDAMHVLGDLLAAFELHALARAFLHELARALDRLLRRDLVAHERQIADEVRPTEAARDGAAVVGHLVERDGDRGRETLDDHPERVADEDHVDPGLVDEAGHGEVVGGDHRDLLAAQLACAQIRDRHLTEIGGSG